MKTTRILVVEDDRILAMSLQSQLRKLGFEVAATVPSGEEAVSKAEELRPDIILMDIKLEGKMDGVEAAEAVRKTLGIPVIFLTAYSTPEILERAKNTAPYGYILKPYDDQQLRIVIEMTVTKHQLEHKLEERERWFAATLMSMGEGVVATDIEGRIIFLNPMGERLTGWSNEDAKGRVLEEVVRLANEESGQPVESPLRKAIQDGRSVTISGHTVLIAKDSTTRPLDDSAAPIFDAMGATLGGVMVFRDVGQQKSAEKDVAKLAAIVAGSDDAIIGLTLEAVIVNWNPGAERLYGYSTSEMEGKSISTLFPPHSEQELKTIAGRIRAGERIPAMETIRRCKDGRDVPVMASVSPIKNANGRVIGAASIDRDITHIKRLEEQFRQAQKMEAIGRLAGGVAHDFNNLLTIINGYSSVLLGTLHDHAKAREMVEEIGRAGERAASLTHQLLAYSRKQILQTRLLNINDLLRDTERMLARVIGEDVELVFTLSESACVVKADASQLEQVVLNLAINARDAMPNGGKLTIATAPVQLPGEAIEDDTEVRAGAYVVVSVSDVGSGMDKVTLSRIFEPFFTTKELGKGTGLGLATVYGIVKQSGGHIQVWSEPNKGSTFKIFLPLLESELEKPETKLLVADLPGGAETVLLAEDQESVRKLSSYLLKKLGYFVLEAANGVEALEIAGRHAVPIELLITDVVMPKMGGRELADAMRSINPHIKVLFMSGYTADATIRLGILEAEVPFLPKPYVLSDLANKIREVLGK